MLVSIYQITLDFFNLFFCEDVKILSFICATLLWILLCIITKYVNN